MKKQIVVALVAALSAAASSVVMADQFTMNQYSNDNWYAGAGLGLGHGGATDSDGNTSNALGWMVDGGYNFATFNNVQLAADLGYMNVGHSTYAVTFEGKGTYAFASTPWNAFGKLGIAGVHHGVVQDPNNGAALALGAGVGYEIAQVKGLDAVLGFDATLGQSPNLWLLSAGVNYQF